MATPEGGYDCTARRWPDPVTGPYRLRVWYSTVRGRMAVAGVEMWGVEPPPPEICQATGWGHPQSEPDGAGGFRHEVWPQLPPTPVTASTIRLPLGRLLAERADLLRRIADEIEHVRVPADAPPGQVESLLASAAERRRGRQVVPVELLETVAAQYRKAETVGDHAPAKAVERALRRIGLNPRPATVRSWIRLARKRGLLPPVGGEADG